jgi:hypothetical protein
MSLAFSIGRRMDNTTSLHYSLSFVKYSQNYLPSGSTILPHTHLKCSSSIHTLSTLMATAVNLTSCSVLNTSNLKYFLEIFFLNRTEQYSAETYWEKSARGTNGFCCSLVGFHHTWDDSSASPKGTIEYLLFSFDCWKSYICYFLLTGAGCHQ